MLNAFKLDKSGSFGRWQMSILKGVNRTEWGCLEIGSSIRIAFTH
jgi:hypothetical protein